MKTIKYATIGTSLITQQFIEGTKLNDAMQLCAVYSRDRKNGESFSAERGNVPVFCSLEELASSDVDAVYVASPNKFHFDQAKILLNAGKHVICEKSVSAHPEEVEELVTLAEKNGLIFIEALMFMHFPQRHILEEAIGRTGILRHASINFCQRSSRYDAFMRGELPNIFNPECETGALLDLGVYCIYPAIYFFGEPSSVSASSCLLSSGVDGTGSVILGYNGFTVSLNYSKLCQGLAPSQFVGDAGCVTVDSISQLDNIVFRANKSEPELLFTSEPKPKLMSYEAYDFASYINEPEKYRKEYERCTSVMLSVSRIMYDIRMKTGILYPSDK